MQRLIPIAVAISFCATGCSKPKAKAPLAVACAAGDVSTIEQDCTCAQAADCPATTGAVWACTATNHCQPDCAVSQCSAVAAECPATCEPKACGEDSECIDGYQCIAGMCAPPVTASAVATCTVLPTAGVLSPTGTKRFWTIAFDAAGNAIPYEEGISGSSVTWGVSGGLDATASSAESTSGLVYKGGSALFTGGGTLSSTTTGTVTATIGTTLCTPSAVTEYAPETAGDLRVVVINAATGVPLPQATVVIDSAAPVMTGSDGSVSGASPGATNTISVFAQNYAYATVAGTVATDVLIPVQPLQPPGAFAGTEAASDFNNLPSPTGTVHLQLSGASIGGNLNDFSFPAFFGSTVETQINLTGTSTGIHLPDGMLLGLGSDMFKSTYTVTASPGIRAFWSLGGNTALSGVASAVNAASDGNFVEAIAQVLPLTSGFDTGVTSGIGVFSSQLGSIGAGDLFAVPLDVPQSLNVSFNMPSLPSYLASTGATLNFDEALVIAGAFAGPEGLVPLALAGGVTATAGGMPNTPGGTGGVLPSTFAPRSGGIEPFPHELLALTTTQASYSGLYGQDAAFALSGRVVLPGEIPYNGGATYPITVGPFMNVPDGMMLTEASRSLNIPTTVDGAALQRLDIVSDGQVQWSVWFAGGVSSVTVPTPPGTFSDPFPWNEAELQSLSLSLGTPETFDELFQFDGIDADDMTSLVDQFSVRWVNEQ